MIADRYSVIELLGKGGMGKVFRCRDKVLDKEVAIKLLLNVDAEKEAMRFQIEAKATARLNHPNILRILDFGQTRSGELFLAAEYLKGRSLASEVDGYGPYKVEEALDLAAHIASALSHAHKNNVLHRDVKPSNVMLVEEEDGRRTIRLVDFGLAKVTTHDDKLTGTGVGLGSPAYCSPEQGDGKAVDERSDIYSFGCLLFYLLTGHPPFQADNPLATIFMHLKKEPPTLSEKGGTDFPAPVEELVAKCLAKDPAARPQTADELEDLIDRLHHEAPEIEESGNQTESQTPPSLSTGRKVLLGLAAITVAVLLILGIDLALFNKRGRGVVEVRNGPDLKRYPDALILTGTWTDRDLERLGKEDPGSLFDCKNQKGIHGSGLVVLKDSNVNTVDLSGSGITDIAFKHLRELKNLKRLSIDNCYSVTDDGIQKITSWEKLEELHMAGTRISDKALACVAANSRINNLGIANCHKIEGTNLGDLRSIHFLDISDDPQLVPHLSALKKLPNLTSLMIKRSNVKDEDLEIIKDLSLTELDLERNINLTNNGITALAALKNLKRLVLSNCPRISLNGIRHLVTLLPPGIEVEPDPRRATDPEEKTDSITDIALKPHLVSPSGDRKFHEALGEWRAKDIPLRIGHEITYLRFREMDNDLSGFEQLKNSKLEILDLTNCSIRDKDLEHLKALPRLEHLLLNECRNITDEGIRRLRSMSLTSLELLGTNITDRAIAYAGEIKTLRNLNLERCPNIKGSTLDSLKVVRSINMKDCGGLEGKNLSKLVSIPHIDHIGLTNAGLEDSDIESMAGVHVRRIHLSYNPELGDKTLAVLSALKDLEWADVSGCRRITRKGIDQFYERTVSEGRNVELQGVRRQSAQGI